MNSMHKVVLTIGTMIIVLSGCSHAVESPQETPKTSITTTTTPIQDEADMFMHDATEQIPSVVDMSLSDISNLIDGVCNSLNGGYGEVSSMEDLEDTVYNGWDHWNNPGEVRTFISLSQKYYCPETL